MFIAWTSVKSLKVCDCSMLDNSHLDVKASHTIKTIEMNTVSEMNEPRDDMVFHVL